MAYSEKQKFIPSNINYTSKDFNSIKSDLIELKSVDFREKLAPPKLKWAARLASPMPAPSSPGAT